MQFVKTKPNCWQCRNMRIEWKARVFSDNYCYAFQVSSTWNIPSKGLTKLEYFFFVNSSASSLWHITLVSPFLFASTHPVKISDSFHKCKIRVLIKKLCNSPREKGFCTWRIKLTILFLENRRAVPISLQQSDGKIPHALPGKVTGVVSTCWHNLLMPIPI